MSHRSTPKRYISSIRDFHKGTPKFYVELNLPTCIHQWQLHVFVSPLLVESWLSGRSAWPKGKKTECLISKKKKRKKCVRGGIRTHAHIRGPEASNSHREQGNVLESGALDHSATLTPRLLIAKLSLL